MVMGQVQDQHRHSLPVNHTHRIEIFDAHYARLHSLDYSVRTARSACSLPTPDDNGTTSLMTDNGVFPVRLIERVRKSSRFPLLIDCEWTAGLGSLGHYIDQNPEEIESWKLRGTYQKKGIRSLLDNKGGILISAAGSGKTVMAARAVQVIADAFQAKNKRKPIILWLAQTIEQVDQGIDALRIAGFYDNGIDPHVMCWQSLQGEQDKLALGIVDILIADEIHSSTDQLYNIAKKCTNAFWRIGLTATYTRTDNRELLMEAAFGRPVTAIDQEQVKAQGSLLDGEVRIYPVGSKDDLKAEIEESAAEDMEGLRQKVNEMTGRARDMKKIQIAEQLLEKTTRNIWYRHARKVGIVESKRRNNLIIDIANQFVGQHRVTLIIVGSKEQGRYLRDRITGSKLVYSGMPVKEGRRKEIIEDARDGKIPCLIATSLADQGMDIPCLEVLINAAGGKGGKDGYLVLQRSARIQRTHGEKTKALIVDFLDSGDGKLLAQSYQRQRKYRDMKFTVIRQEKVA